MIWRFRILNCTHVQIKVELDGSPLKLVWIFHKPTLFCLLNSNSRRFGRIAISIYSFDSSKHFWSPLFPPPPPQKKITVPLHDLPHFAWECIPLQIKNLLGEYKSQCNATGSVPMPSTQKDMHILMRFFKCWNNWTLGWLQTVLLWGRGWVFLYADLNPGCFQPRLLAWQATLLPTWPPCLLN